MLWNRSAGGEMGPVPDLHPAQIDLLDAQRCHQNALAAIDDGLTYAGNERPTLRDRLLDVRAALQGGTA